MDYLAVELWENVGLSSRTYVAGPDYSSDRVPLPIDTDRASLQAGKEWLRLPDETPAYCQATVRSESRPSATITDSPYVLRIYVFSLPKDRWPHERNEGVAAFLHDIDQIYGSDANSVASVTVSVNQAGHLWLADYYADLEREIESQHEPLAELDEDALVAAADARGEDHYLAVATSPAAGSRIKPGESGYYGIGWHTESQQDAGLAAVDECRKQGGGSACFSNASGKSLRGGCVGPAMAKWRDRDKDAGRTYVVTSSSFRDLIARDLRSGCGTAALAGKYEETVVERSCEIVRVMCAADPVPTVDGP